MVVLLQPNRLISTYTRGSSTGYVHYTNKMHKRNVLLSGLDKQQDLGYNSPPASAGASPPNQDIHVVIGYYQGNDFPWLQGENLTEGKSSS